MSQIWDNALLSKQARFHPAARDALRSFPEDVRRAFGKAIYDLQMGNALTMPLSRPMPVLGHGAAEIRIRDKTGSYRAFYVVRVADAVLVFHAFRKSTAKTPRRELELGRRRLQELTR